MPAVSRSLNPSWEHFGLVGRKEFFSVQALIYPFKFLIARGKWQHLFNHLQMWAAQNSLCVCRLWAPSREKGCGLGVLCPAERDKLGWCCFVLRCSPLHHYSLKIKKDFSLRSLFNSEGKGWENNIIFSVPCFMCRASFPAYSVFG